MSIINSSTKFVGINPNFPTTERKSAQNNASQEVVTMQDITDTVLHVSPTPPDPAPLAFANAATVGALSYSPTYNNGTSGVGATLTATVNGVLTDGSAIGKIDISYTPIAGDVILVKNQSGGVSNGLYVITTVGSVSTPYVLTRFTDFDQSAELYPLQVNVIGGNSNAVKYFIQTTTNPTVGTSNLIFSLSNLQPPASQIAFIDTVIDTPLSNIVYADGTALPTIPGSGATLTSTVNGALGTYYGLTANVNSTIALGFTRVLLINQTNPAYNGDYQVINAGSASTKWQLRRIQTVAGGFDRYTRYFVVSNASSTKAGKIYFTKPNNPILTNATIGTAAINIFEYPQIDAVPTDASVNAVSSNGVFDALANKQDTLVSATNIKTINGTTLLGSGDIAISTGLTIGTTPISSGTVGRILFQGTGNVTQQDSTLFWDNTNKRLGLGANGNTPTSALFVRTNLTTANDVFTLQNGQYGNPIFRVRDNATASQSTMGSLFVAARIYGSNSTVTGNEFDLGGYGLGASYGNATTNAVWLNNQGNIGDGDGTSVISVTSNVYINLQTTKKYKFEAQTGHFGIGNVGTLGARLDVRAQGALSTDIAFRVRNSADTSNLLSIAGNGSVLFRAGYASGGIEFVDTGVFPYSIPRFGPNVMIDIYNEFIRAKLLKVSSGEYSTDYLGLNRDGVWVNQLKGVDQSGNVNVLLNVNSYNNNTIFDLISRSNNNTNFINFSGNGLNNKFTISDQANVSIGGSTFGTSSKFVISQFTGTAPTTSPTDAFQQYSADIVAGNAAPHFRTENGDIIKLYKETTGVTASTLVSNLGLPLTDTDTFDGYTLKQIVKALRNLGILA